MRDPEAGPMHNTLGSVPDVERAKSSLFRLLFQRYECSWEEIKAIQVELSADRLDGRRCEKTIPGIIERGRGGEYLIPLNTTPPLIVNWLCHYIRPGLYSPERRLLSQWLQEAVSEVRLRVVG